jgi:hypothetical protein
MDLDDAFAPGELEVGNLTPEQHQAIIAEGSQLLADMLYTRDEVLRWRRALRVAQGWHHCFDCDLWTERKEHEPCANCGSLAAPSR